MLGIKSLIGSVSRASYSIVNTCVNNISKHMNIQVRCMANHKHKKIIKEARGFRGRANRCFQVAYHRVIKARQYAYRDRKVKKRDMRALWIQRINAATRIYGLNYNLFTFKSKHVDLVLNRKVLADLAVNEPLSFKAVVDVVKQG